MSAKALQRPPPSAAPAPSVRRPPCRVFFAAASSRLSHDALNTLKAFVAAWRKRRGRLTLIGHTDRRGAPIFNQRLGRMRANEVAAALHELGVPLGQMVRMRSEASDRPLDPGDGEAAWARNRRVEIWPGGAD